MKEVVNDLFINLKVLKKALERVERAFGKESLKKYFPRAEEWLKGKSNPTLNQLEKLASKALIPFYLFFLKDLPEEKISFLYFRAKGEKVEASPELEYTISVIKMRQNFLSAYLEELGWEKNRFIGKINTNMEINQASEIIRDELQLKPNWAEEQKSWSQAFEFLKGRIENLRIFIFTNNVVDNNNYRKLNPREFSGFSLIDEYAPVILVNSADYIASQIFTLIHELSHIGLGMPEEGIFSFMEIDEYQNEIEIFCNKVTGEVLVPERAIIKAFKIYGKNYETLARKFKVSQAVIGLRLLTLGIISKEEYEKEVKYRYETLEEIKKKKEETSGGDFYKIQEKKLGKLFVEIVRCALADGFITYTDAFRLTNLYGKSFYNLVEKRSIKRENRIARHIPS